MFKENRFITISYLVSIQKLTFLDGRYQLTAFSYQ